MNQQTSIRAVLTLWGAGQENIDVNKGDPPVLGWWRWLWKGLRGNRKVDQKRLGAVSAGLGTVEQRP